MKKILILLLISANFCPALLAQNGYNDDAFKQLEELLPTPNQFRTASGAPTKEYWKQKVDYTIAITLDDKNQSLTGKQDIVYHNNSPYDLEYLWLQLDMNRYHPNSDGYLVQQIHPSVYKSSNASFRYLKRFDNQKFDASYKISSVRDVAGNPLPFTIVKTMMRIDLPKGLKSGEVFKFSIDWQYNILDAKKINARTGYEYFKEDDNYIYQISHWFPRLCVFDDVNGWQNKQFLGRGEFALDFGDYNVSIDVPADHIVAATGELSNADEVLESKWKERLRKAKTAKNPLFIVTPDEAKKRESSKSNKRKIWKFEAKNVRDFAWASSRKFIWDAWGVKIKDKTVLAMSAYPNEGEPMWSLFSTHAIALALKVYSKYTIPYPYPAAWSVNGPVYGMEYPMISFNGPRPEKDGTYSAVTKRRLISVIIHEIGHNFFPMIISSDERQWTWMDEGMNTFCQYLTEQEWERNYPSARGPANAIVRYMSSPKSTIVPIMSNSESILQFGNNAYGKPASALNILRETVMGRSNFDYAFKKYAERWAFKHPEPADFFRTMEDASGVDLDWYWRGWFYSTDAVDIAIKDVKRARIDSKNPSVEKPLAKKKKNKSYENISKQNNDKENMRYWIEDYSYLADFYTKYDRYQVTAADKKRYQDFYQALDDQEKKIINSRQYHYFVHFENVGGLVMPIIVELNYEDGSKEIRRFPAEIWAQNNKTVYKMISTNKKLNHLLLDPYKETADIDIHNNYFPRKIIESQFSIFKRSQGKRKNLMQKEKSGDL